MNSVLVKAKTAADAADYLTLPYTVILKKDEDGDVVARIQELDGCMAHGADEAEALGNLRGIQQAWIESCLESGASVPEPEEEEVLPSGKWVQRVPRTLHYKLTQLAKKEEVSLNQLVTAILSEAAAAKVIVHADANFGFTWAAHRTGHHAPRRASHLWDGITIPVEDATGGGNLDQAGSIRFLHSLDFIHGMGLATPTITGVSISKKKENAKTEELAAARYFTGR